MATLQQIGDFKINGTSMTLPVFPYEWIHPKIQGYNMRGRPMRQGKPSCIWEFAAQIKTGQMDELYSFLLSRSYDTEVTIRTLDIRLAGYTFANFIAVMHLPEIEFKRPILNPVRVLFTGLTPA